MERTVLDVKYAIRSLGRAPGFFLVATLTLALGVGANTAIFSVVHGALLRPLAYPADERIATLEDSQTARAFMDWKDAAQSVEAIGAWRNGTFNLSGLGAPQRVPGAIVSDTFFEVFAVPAARGRVIGPTDVPGGGRVAVLSDGLWRRSFAGDPAVLDRIITVSGETVRIVGIMPAAFEFPVEADLWLSSKFSLPEHSLTPNVDPLRLRPSSYLWSAVRLRPGVSHAAAAAERRAILNAGRPQTTAVEAADVGPSLVRLRERLFGDMRRPLLLLLLSVGLLLLLACANIANLLLARATSRRQEMAVRAALGASRGMLVRQVLTEGLVLAVLGGAAGVVLAAWMLPALLKIAPTGVRYVHAEVSVLVALAALAAAVLAGVTAGLFPALQASRAAQQSGLGGAGRIAGGAEGRRVRQALVVAQVALSLALLVAAGLLLRSFSHILAVDPGFRAEGLWTFRIDLPTERYRTPESQGMFYEALLDNLGAVRGVIDVAATTRLPFTTGESTRGIVPEGAAPRPNDGALFRVVSPNYFTVMGVPLVAGRALTAQDQAGSPPAAVINETMARKFWPGESAVGRRFRISNEPASIEVVGVARDMKHVDLREEQGAAYFLPLQQAPWSYMTIVMRTDPATEVASATREAVGAVDSDVPVPALRSMDELMAGSLALERFQLIVTGAFAILALALASLGLYGVMSYLVGRRRKEMAVRLALGAQPGRLVALIMRDALFLVGIGCAVGAGMSVLVARSLQGMLFGVGSSDLLTLAGAVLLLTTVAGLASYVPARRATLVDPASALRSD